MTIYKIAKDIDMTLVMDVEADSLEEALDKVDDAWGNDSEFVRNFLDQAEITDESTYQVSDIYANCASMPFDELMG